MTYIKEFEVELARKLESTEETDAIVRWVSEKVLEIYRIGINAGHVPVLNGNCDTVGNPPSSCALSKKDAALQLF